VNKYVKNRAYLEFFKQGLIIANNINIEYGLPPQTVKEKDEEDDEKFGGALVGDPELNSNTGITVLGIRSKYIYDDVVDMDMGAFYPNMIMALNISPNCMIAKLLLDTTIEDIYNIKDIEEDKYDAGRDFVDNLLICNPANMGSKWFNLPKIEELNTLIRQKFSLNKQSKIIITKSSVNTYYLEKVTIDIKGGSSNQYCFQN